MTRICVRALTQGAKQAGNRMNVVLVVLVTDGVRLSEASV